MRSSLLILPILINLSLCYLYPPNRNQKANFQEEKDDIIITSNSKHAFTAEGVQMTTGYAVVNESQGSALFYWYFEATKRAPAATIIWLTGGPGCSSSTASFGEKMAPLLIGKDLNLYLRPNSWSDDYGVVYIDNPIGVGYSTIGNGTSRTSANESAVDFVKALSAIKTLNPEWFQRDLYIFGESYAGHYIPAYSWHLLQSGKFPELKGIGVGDMWTDPINQMKHNADYAFTLGLISFQQWDFFKQMENDTIDDINNGKWADALDKFNWEIGNISEIAAGVDQYNSRNYKGDPEAQQRVDFLNLNTTKEMIQVAQEKVWVECSDSVGDAYTNDFMKSYATYVSTLLQEKQIRILLYNGADDIIVNTPSWSQYINKLEWSGSKDFVAKERQVWRVGGEIAGYWRQEGVFTQLIVLKAGHMVPMNQPDNSREMIRTFIEELEWQS